MPTPPPTRDTWDARDAAASRDARWTGATGATGTVGAWSAGTPGAVAAPERADLEDPQAADLDPYAAFDGLDTDPGPAPVDPAELARQHVTAVLVAHEGRRWLPRTLEALGRLDRAPDLLVAVDTASKDDSLDLLGRALGEPAVVRVGRTTGFGAAVDAALVAADARTGAGRPGRAGTAGGAGRVEWVWLLHDDAAPAPDALLRLLECAVRDPDVAVVGPKVLGWGDQRQLLEVGLTITNGGRRYTGLERRELDQGQHDETRDVLAVGSAGMLVRRSVWEELGGFDPVLALFRDDVDFGWRANLAGHRVVVCPDAVVHHAEAAAHGRRRLGVTRRRAHLVDRRNALHVVLANSSRRRLALALLQVTGGCLLRALGFLFGKLPLTALEELLALGSVLVRPDRLLGARRARARLRRREPEELRPLFPPRGHQVRHAGETLLAVVSGAGAGQDLTVARRRAAPPGGGAGDDDADEEPESSTSAVLGVLGRPPVALGLALLVVALLAERALLVGGRLMGGALLPAPDRVGALWDTYTESWHGVGLGSATAAPPYLAVLGVLSVGTLGSVPTLVGILLLLSVPFAGLSAYVALRPVVTGAWVRVWAAAAYGLLPATTGAIAAGRLGTCVAIVATPLLGLAVLRTLGRPGAPGAARTAWSAGLLLALVTAFVPLAWLVAVLLAAAAIGLGYRDRASLLRLGVLLAVPPVLLVPWTFEVLRTPVLLFGEAGAPGPGLSDPRLPAWAVALGDPGGPGSAPVWLFAAVALAGLAGVLRQSRRRAATAGLVVALGGLVLGLVVSRVPVTGPTLDAPVAGWPGWPASLVVLGLLVAAASGAEGMHRRLAGASFSWRQPAAVVLTVAAVATPLVATAWWVWRGADDPLDRRDPAVLPAYVAAENAGPDRTRTLVLAQDGDGSVSYALLRDAGPRLGDAETGPGRDESGPADRAVADLVSGRGTDDRAALQSLAVAYVYLPAPADPTLSATLDTVSGLVRASAPEGAAMWRVDAEVARLRVVAPDGTAEVLESEAVGATTRLSPGPDGRRLVLAERADPGWTATLEGDALEPVTVDGWAQAFALPTSGGELVLSHEDDRRTRWLWAQGVLALVVLVLALPAARRTDGGVEDVADAPEEGASRERVKEYAPAGAPSRSEGADAREVGGVAAAVGGGAAAAAGTGSRRAGSPDAAEPTAEGTGEDRAGTRARSAAEGTAARGRRRTGARQPVPDAGVEDPLGDGAAAGSAEGGSAGEPASGRRPGRGRGKRAAGDNRRIGGRALPGRRQRGTGRVSAEDWLGDADPADGDEPPEAGDGVGPRPDAPAQPLPRRVPPDGAADARDDGPPPTYVPRRAARRRAPEQRAEPTAPPAPAPDRASAESGPSGRPTRGERDEQTGAAPRTADGTPPAAERAEQVGGWVPQRPDDGRQR